MSNWIELRVGVLVALALACGPVAGNDDSYLYVAPEDLDSFWVATRKMAPRYPRGPQTRGMQGCVSLAYVIEGDGTTARHVALAVSPSMVFTESAIEAAKKFRFEPGEENADRQPVLTFETFTFLVNFDRNWASPEDEVILAATCTEAAMEKLASLGGGAN